MWAERSTIKFIPSRGGCGALEIQKTSAMTINIKSPQQVRTRLFTSESVSEGHPDKVADQVSDAILDAYLDLDPLAKVACEVLITDRQLIIAGEVASTAHVDAIAVAKNVIGRIGYTDPSTGFDARNAVYLSLLHEQSPEIHASVFAGGAGDQGLMFGYACTETPAFMPMPIWLAHRLMERQSQLRRTGAIPWLLPDAKAQVTVIYAGDEPVGVDTVVLSTQHRSHILQEEIRETVTREIILPVIREFFPGADPKILVNPSGSFTIGGPQGDTGLTGRKIIVDSYGGSSPHGGGAFSGKDPSKVDRSAAYAARWVAKHLVAAGLASRCTVQLAYAIGVAEPVSIHVDTHGTGLVDDQELAAHCGKVFDLRPAGIIQALGLDRPIYQSTASYGHFGREGFPWENLDTKHVELLAEIAAPILKNH